MDLKTLQIFSSVLRHRSFTQAADELHMSISAVSRSIARLEETLGLPLFDRDRRGMRPTGAAAELSRVAGRMEADWRELQRTLSSSASLSGELRIFCSVTATHRLLSPLISAYRDACPAVDVLLITGDQADGLERVKRGDADVAVIARPAQLPDSIAYRHVAASPLRLCIPGNDGPLRQRLDGASADERDALLGEMPWILPERGVSKDAIERWLIERYAQLPPIYARVAGHEAILAMVSLGLGVGMVPELVIEASGLADTLEVAALAHQPGALEIGLCARAGRVQDPIVAELWRVSGKRA